jgi:Zn-dependent protease with chaperone function
MFESIYASLHIAQCANVIVPDATEQAMRYYNSGNLLWIVKQLWILAIPLLFLFTGFSAKLEKTAAKWGKNWFFTIVVYLLFFIPIYQLLLLPLDFYSNYIRPHEYGLSSQTLGRWFSHYGTGVLIGAVFALVFLWIFYLLLKKSPRRWWFYSTLVSIALLFFMMLVQPVWIDPLFNRFGPMQNKELEGQILSLASRAGIEQSRVYEVDKSQDTNMLNAYVVGFGSTRRIVLWDTTIQKLTPDEILFVMGHEMGHYVLHHVWWGMLFSSAMAFLVFYLIYRSSQFFMHRYHHRFGFSHLSQIASLPLLIFLMSVFNLLSTPLDNAFSRQIEHNADTFGLEITQDNQAAGNAFLALQMQNLANPRPGALFKFWRSTHPPLGERVDYCNEYCPWTEGKPLKYGKFFKE